MLVYLQLIESEEDKNKCERLYYRYRGLMFHVANKLLKNERDAEDAVHQAFLAIIKNFQKIRDVNCPETCAYVVIIVERKAIDMLRARSRNNGVELDEDICGVDIPLPGDGGLADAMARLNPRYREILLLRYDSGYSVKELAKQLDMTQPTVRKLIWRAREELRKQLEKDGEPV